MLSDRQALLEFLAFLEHRELLEELDFVAHSRLTQQFVPPALPGDGLRPRSL
jgi:hypothetical protein